MSSSQTPIHVQFGRIQSTVPSFMIIATNQRRPPVWWGNLSRMRMCEDTLEDRELTNKRVVSTSTSSTSTLTLPEHAPGACFVYALPTKNEIASRQHRSKCTSMNRTLLLMTITHLLITLSFYRGISIYIQNDWDKAAVARRGNEGSVERLPRFSMTLSSCSWEMTTLSQLSLQRMELK